MKQIFILTIFLAPFISSAQFTENFDDNRNRWDVTSDNNSTRKIESGKYILETLEKDHGKFITMPHFFDPFKDFEMEASFVQRSGEDDNGFGLFWGKLNSSKYNEFVITTNGYYMIGSKGSDSWTKTSLVKPMGEPNVLRVVKDGFTISCYLNGDRVFKDELPSNGFAAGFLNYIDMVLEVDYFKVNQKNSEIKLVQNLPSGIIKENLGPNINTPADEVSPIISADGQTLYFGREDYEQNTKGVDDLEDIWYSKFDGTSWQLAINPGSPVNDVNANNPASISPDNNTLVFAMYNKFTFRKRTESGWSEMIDMGISYTNESKYQEAQLSADGKVMIFAVKTPNNIFYRTDIDEKDIYVSLQDKNGNWSAPINLGPTLNTAGNEMSPFLSADGRTLYFGSEGRPGYGDADIFMSKRIGDGWTKWSEPLNLGPDINTSGFDAYYTVPASGAYAYVVSERNSYGKADIFRIKLPQVVKPEAVVLLSGRALNAKTKEPIAAEIILDNLQTGIEVAEANSDPSNGNYKIILLPGANYGIHAAAKGYLSVNENIELASIHEYTEMNKDLLLMPIEVGLTLALNNVFFEQGRPILRKESFPELDRLVQIMKANPHMQIELGGHTDNVGSSSALMKLSQDRVDAVKKYLIDQGINQKRISGKGYGATMPREKNDTEEHKKMNRRVEFKILKT
ncbi:MAG TPA: OmpA family protein [Cytophagales bacterium]|jgi:outer membrane protein OmpA-like peptidoglycan-associated protein|nr:OmpA family protein [Cytophagales bacterium]